MTVKNITEQVEAVFGRQPEQYIYRLINDALNEVAAKRQHNLKHALYNIIYKQRWQSITDAMIDIVKVEVKDTDGRYVRVPRLVDSHTLLKEDTDVSTSIGGLI
tara:strand:+ start:34 stop:345 length:312 start_codon:yes stop_codon:yes gene_type:complete